MRSYFYKSLLVALPILLTFLSCDSTTEVRFANEKIVNLPFVDSIGFASITGDTLRFDPPLSGEYLSHQTYNDQKQHLWIGLKSEYYRLDIYSLDEKRALGSIQFDSEGPDGIKGGIDGFYFHNSDTIFLLSNEANRVYLMNERSKIVDIFDFSNVPLPDGFSEYDAYANQGLKNGPVYVASNNTLQFYTYRWLKSSEDNFDYQAFASYSIVERKFVSIYGNYPQNYVRGNNFILYNDPLLAVVDTLSFVQFGASEYLAAYNNKTGDLLYVSNEHCEHWKGAPEALPMRGEFQKESDWLIEQPAYPVLLHDENNKIIYRFLKHKQPLLNIDGLLNERWFGPWCISMYNYGLKRVGHYELPKNALLPVIAFTALDDLWIKNPSLPPDENSIMFYRFKPTINENGQ
ncbi:MAG: hypothetical protein ACI9DJ_003429 [Algoriphagus sp.]|jgi:hypothetical protein